MPFAQLSLERQQRIDAVCREFEDALQDDPPPSLAAFYDRLPSEDRTEGLFELMALDIELRAANNHLPALDHYRSQFPHESELVDRIYGQVLCELSAGSSTEQPEPVTGDIGREKLGDFRLVREIGRGGMGMVFEAIQESLERRVALKILPRTALLNETGSLRFERESRAVARLHHSNIVEIYGRGEHDGVSYFAMQFIDGVGLDQVIRETSSACKQADGVGKETTDLGRHSHQAAADTTTVGTTDASDSSSRSARINAARVAARIGFEIASALHYAHSQGVLHRDVKPSNILVDRQGTAWLADFGLAKLVTGSDDGSLTERGDVLGTLRYMAPENFNGLTDVRSDVFCLGLTLLELLTRRPAYATLDRQELLRQRLRGDPPPLDLLNNTVPSDLATIIRKAVDPELSGRYQTAGELADDLQRYLNDEPIQARRVSHGEQLRRWASRNKVLAASLMTTVGLLLLTTIGAITAATYFKGLEAIQRKLANEKGVLAQRNAELATSNGSLAVKSGELAQKNERLALEARDERNRATLLVADVFTKQGLDAAANGNVRESLMWFAGAAAKSQPLDARRYRDNVGRYRRLSRQMTPPVANLPITAPVLRMEFHPDGRILLVQFRPPNPAVLLDIATALEIPLPQSIGVVQSLAWSPDGKRLYVGGDGRVTGLRFPELDEPFVISGLTSVEQVQPDAAGPPMLVQQLECDASGRYVALAANSIVRVWDSESKRFKGPPISHPAPITGLMFSPDAKWLVSIDNANRFHAFQTLSLDEAESSFAPAFQGIHISSSTGTWVPPKFVRRGTALLTSWESGQMEVWDLDIRQIVAKIHHKAGIPNCILAMGDDVCVGGHAGTEILHFDPGQPRVTQSSLETTKLDCLTASHDPIRGNLFVGYAGQDSELWSLADRRPLPHSVFHSAGCLASAFSRDGQSLATMGAGESVIRVSKMPDEGSGQFAIRLRNEIHHADFSADSHHVAVVDFTGAIEVWDLASKSRVAAFAEPVTAPSNRTIAARFLPDLQRLVVFQRIDRHRSQFDIWNWRAGKLLQSLPLDVESDTLNSPLPVLARDSSHLLISQGPGRATVLDLSAAEIQPQTVSDAAVQAWQAISPDGAWLGGRINLVNGVLIQRPTLIHEGDEVAQGEPAKAIKLGPFEHLGTLSDMSFSPDMKLIATSAWDHTAKVWEPRWPSSTASGGIQLRKSFPHPSTVYYSEFSRDSQNLLTVSKDGTARVWNIASGQVVGAPITAAQDLGAHFRPGHDELIVVDFEGHFDIWDWRQATRLWPTTRFFKQPDTIWGDRRSLVLSPDGHYVAMSGMGAVHVIDLTPLDDRDIPDVGKLINESEVLSGLRLLPNGQPAKLTSEEWTRQYQN